MPEELSPSTHGPDRPVWLGVLAKSPIDDLAPLVDRLASDRDFETVRAPEVGLVMVRGRAGGRGQRFNLGEMTVTRCVVRIQGTDIAGYGYVAGRKSEEALAVAKLDAIFQDLGAESPMVQGVVSGLQAKISDNRRDRAEKVAATKVDFFTMVRGDD